MVQLSGDEAGNEPEPADTPEDEPAFEPLSRRQVVWKLLIMPAIVGVGFVAIQGLLLDEFVASERTAELVRWGLILTLPWILILATKHRSTLLPFLAPVLLVLDVLFVVFIVMDSFVLLPVALLATSFVGPGRWQDGVVFMLPTAVCMQAVMLSTVMEPGTGQTLLLLGGLLGMFIAWIPIQRRMFRGARGLD